MVTLARLREIQASFPRKDVPSELVSELVDALVELTERVQEFDNMFDDEPWDGG